MSFALTSLKSTQIPLNVTKIDANAFPAWVCIPLIHSQIIDKFPLITLFPGQQSTLASLF
jgi:hypothetical protein